MSNPSAADGPRAADGAPEVCDDLGEPPPRGSPPPSPKPGLREAGEQNAPLPIVQSGPGVSQSQAENDPLLTSASSSFDAAEFDGARRQIFLAVGESQCHIQTLERGFVEQCGSIPEDAKKMLSVLRTLSSDIKLKTSELCLSVDQSGSWCERDQQWEREDGPLEVQVDARHAARIQGWRGKEHGKGRMQLSTGEICEGHWAEGKERIFTEGRETSLPTADTRNDDADPKAVSCRGLLDGRKLRSQRSQKNRLETASTKKACEHCGVDDYLYKVRVCSGCNLALYCSEACQMAARRSHRRICDIASMLPSRDSDQLTLEYDKDKLVDLDAGLRYATKYMDSLKHLKIDLIEMVSGDAPKLSAKQLHSLLKSKKGSLGSLILQSSGNLYVPGVSKIGDEMWKELLGLKQLRLEHMICNEVQSLHDVIDQQKNTLMFLGLPALGIDWHKAKTRRSVALAVGACRHLVQLDLRGWSLMDSDLKVMLQDLPDLRILRLTRDSNKDHEFTDNTCGLIARKCPGLQEMNLACHDQMSVKGLRKIFGGCSHLRAFYTTTRKLCCKDIKSLLDIAPQLMYLSLSDKVGLSEGELGAIIEATGGRTVFQLGIGNEQMELIAGRPDGISDKTREKYDRQQDVLLDIWSRMTHPEVPNVWAGMLEE